MKNKKLLSSLVMLFLSILFLSCKTEVEVVEQKQFTISYISERGQITEFEKVVPDGYTITEQDLINLTHSGYNFEGWFSRNEPITVGQKITKNTILIGKWTEIKDTIAPKDVKSFNVNANDNKAIITWEYPIDLDCEGVSLTISTANEIIEENLRFSREVTSYSVNGLTNNTEYTFTLKTFDKSFNYSNGKSKTITPVSTADTTAPKEVRNFEVNANDGNAVLTWEYENDFDCEGASITISSNNEVIAENLTFGRSVSSYNVTKLTNDTTYTFTLKTFDKSLNYSKGKSCTVTPRSTADTTAPKDVRKFSVNANDGKAVLTWEYENDFDCEGASITISSNNEVIAENLTFGRSVNSYNVTELTNDTTYTFTLKTFDKSLNYSKGKSCTVTPRSTADTTAPKDVRKFSVNANDEKAILTWEYENDLDCEGVILTIIANNEIIKDNLIFGKGITNYNVSGLTNNTEYTFILKTFDKSLNYSVGKTKTITPKSTVDNTPPKEVKVFTVNANDGKAVVTWEYGLDPDCEGVDLTISSRDEILAYNLTFGKGVKSYSVTGLNNDTPYTFTLKTFDKNLNYSNGITKTVTPKSTADTTAPKEVKGFTVNANDGKAVVTWAYDTDLDCEGVSLIISKNGEIVSDNLTFGKGITSYIVTGLTNDTEYSFTLKTFDKSFNYSNGKTITKTPVKTTDEQAPGDVTSLNIVESNKTAIITWVDPADTDLYAIEIEVVESTPIRAIAPIQPNTVLVAPKMQTYVLSSLKQDTTYNIIVTPIDLAGNRGNSISKDFTLSDSSSTPNQNFMTLQLNPEYTTPINKPYDVTIGINNVADVAVVKYDKGSHDTDYFTNHGIIINTAPYKFNVNEVKTYTVFVQDVDGRREVKEIEIKNLDFQNPGEPYCTGSYDSKTNKIQIHWSVETGAKSVIINDGVTDHEIIPSTNYYGDYYIDNISSDSSGKIYNYTVTQTDAAGNISIPAHVSVLVSPNPTQPIFNTHKEIKLRTGDHDKIKYINLKGFNFKATDVVVDQFKLTFSNSSLDSKETITIVDDKSLKIPYKVPSTEGQYEVNIQYGDTGNKTTITLSVTKSREIGDVLLNDGTFISSNQIPKDLKVTDAIGLVGGFNEEGRTILISLTARELGLTLDNSYGDEANFENIICFPTEYCTYDSDKNPLIEGIEFWGDKEGIDNWQEICKMDPEGVKKPSINYPAFNYANNFGVEAGFPEGYQTGWFIPSLAELYSYMLNYDALNDIFRNKFSYDSGVIYIDDPWSSSQSDEYWYHGMCIYTFTKPIKLYSIHKNDKNQVRCIRYLD